MATGYERYGGGYTAAALYGNNNPQGYGWSTQTAAAAQSAGLNQGNLGISTQPRADGSYSFGNATPSNDPGGGGPTNVRREEGGDGGGDGGNKDSALGTLTADEIRAGIAYLEATTGLSAQELLNRNDDVGRVAGSLLEQLSIANERALEAAQAGLLRRGILRSGIAGRDMGRVSEEAALRSEDIIGRQESEQRDIRLQLDSLLSQLEMQKAQMVADIEASNFDAAEKAALLNEIDRLNLDQLNELSIALTGQPIELPNANPIGSTENPVSHTTQPLTPVGSNTNR